MLECVLLFARRRVEEFGWFRQTPVSASLRRGAITLVHFVHWRVMAERGGFEPPIQV